MLKVAVCDSNACICSYIEQLIKHILGKHYIDIEEFSNGMELYHNIKTGCDFDMIFIELFQKKIILFSICPPLLLLWIIYQK